MAPMQIAQAQPQPFLRLSVGLRALEAVAAEKLPIDSVAGVHVESATRDAYLDVHNNSLEPSALSTANLTFGTLTPSQFESLKAEFGGLSQVKFSAQESYQASDFLPPALQALVGHDLEVPAEPTSIPGSSPWSLMPFDEERVVDLTANCHGTSWEAVCAYQGQNDLDIFFGDPLGMESLLGDSDTFAPVKGAVSGTTINTDSLLPGDLIAFSNPDGGGYNALLHTAVYAGGGLFFEKPDTEGAEDGDAPYRLATPDMVRRPIEHFLGGPVQAQAYRAISPLAKPEEAFGAGADEDVLAWEQSQGRPLGMPLLRQLELGIGGGVRAEGLTTLVDQPILIDRKGRGVPVPFAC